MAQEILLGRSVRVNVFAVNLESQRSKIGSQLCVTWCLHPIRNKIENCLVTMVLHTHTYFPWASSCSLIGQLLPNVS